MESKKFDSSLLFTVGIMAPTKNLKYHSQMERNTVITEWRKKSGKDFALLSPPESISLKTLKESIALNC